MLQGNYLKFVETCNISYRLMKMSLSFTFLHGICFLTKGLCFFKKKTTQRQTNSWNKHFSCRNTICELMQYILNGIKKPHHFFSCITFVWKEGFHFWKNMCLFVLLFGSYGRAYCIHAVMSLLQMILIYIHVYFRFLK